MSYKKPFILRVVIQHELPFKGQYAMDEEVTKEYATKKGLIQAAHYWARYYQVDSELWRGGYYSNNTLFKTVSNSRLVMHAYQQRASIDYQALSIDLSTIVSRKGLGEDMRGEAYKEASSTKGTAK